MTISRKLLHWLVALVIGMGLAACGNERERGPVVLAPASMQEALEDVAEAWSERGHAAPLLSFAGTQAQARQLEQGAPADVIITADREWMDWLDKRGLVETGSRRVIAANGLTLVSSAPFDPDDTIERRVNALGDGRLALADTQAVPAGRYARTALENMGLWGTVARSVVPAENVRAALALVETGEAPLGVVYQTDAAASDRVHGIAFDPRDVPDISYPAALVTGARHTERAAFLQFLSSEAAQAIFARHHFISPGRRS